MQSALESLGSHRRGAGPRKHAGDSCQSLGLMSKWANGPIPLGALSICVVPLFLVRREK